MNAHTEFKFTTLASRASPIPCGSAIHRVIRDMTSGTVNYPSCLPSFDLAMYDTLNTTSVWPKHVTAARWSLGVLRAKASCSSWVV